MTKNIIISIMIGLGLIWVLTYDTGEKNTAKGLDVVREEDGIQYIRIFARAGYTPSKIQAKANMPTVLEMETQGTYDCSSSINIPQIGYRNALPATGITEIEIPQGKTAETLHILCAMGMYRATVNFSQ